jgi:hypothetical protein
MICSLGWYVSSHFWELQNPPKQAGLLLSVFLDVSHGCFGLVSNKTLLPSSRERPTARRAPSSYLRLPRLLPGYTKVLIKSIRKKAATHGRYGHSPGKSHGLVGPSIEGVYHKHAARRLDRPFTYSGEPNYHIQLLKIVAKLVGVGCGHNYLYRYMYVCS